MTDDSLLPEKRRCGRIALVGRPNVGKSTLFNRLVGVHLSAVTHKPQTTRYNIRGVLTQASRQMIFVDTPGLHGASRSPLGRIMNGNALRALNDVDVIAQVATFDRWSNEDEALVKVTKAIDNPKFLLLNKVDLQRDKPALLRTIDTFDRRRLFDEIFPLSALRDRHFDALFQALARYLPEGDFMFDEDQLSDRSERFIAAELVREQLMSELNQELPYALHVEIERFEESKPTVNILAVVYIRRKSQCPIVIGRGGDRLKRVGTRSRRAIEALLGRRIFLELWVKAKGAWDRDPAVVRSYTGGEGGIP